MFVLFCFFADIGLRTVGELIIDINIRCIMNPQGEPPSPPFPQSLFIGFCHLPVGVIRQSSGCLGKTGALVAGVRSRNFLAFELAPTTVAAPPASIAPAAFAPSWNGRDRSLPESGANPGLTDLDAASTESRGWVSGSFVEGTAT
jgi:hypothetical protein